MDNKEEFKEYMSQIELAINAKDSIILILEEEIKVRKEWFKVNTWFMLGLGIILGIMGGLILYPFIAAL